MGTRKSRYILANAQAPVTRLAANRFLNTISFGAATARTNMATSTKTTIVPLTGETDDATRLMSIGYEAYVSEQLTDNTLPTLLSFVKTDVDGGGGANNSPFRQYFWTHLMHSSAQLRLKSAYALSQIFVVNSLANSGGGGDPFAHKYFDDLVKSTLSTNTSSFRALLTDVTLSVTMARMLTYINNKRASATVKPDQNFIRELLQLMSPGLFHQRIDGTFFLDANGVKRQTFLPSQMELLAGAITGMGDNTLGHSEPLLNTGDGRRIYQNAVDATAVEITMPAYLDDNGNALTPVVIPAKLLNACRLNFEMPVNGYPITVTGLTTFTVATEISRNALNGDGTGRPFSFRLTNDFTSAANRIDATVDAGVVNVSTQATVTTRNASGVAINHGLSTGQVIFSKGNVRETIDALLDWCFNHPSTAPFFAKSMIKHLVTSNPSPDYVKRVALKFINNGNGVRGDISAVIKAAVLDAEAIHDFGVNPNNHGRYLTVIDKIARVARAFRVDNVHVHGIENKFIAGSAGAVFTKPLINSDFAACGLYTTGSFRPFESGSIFNFFLPDFQPAGQVLATVGKLAPESQLEVVGTKNAWMQMVSQLCDTQMPTQAFDNFVEQPGPNLLNNPGGNQGVTGLDFVLDPLGYKATAVSGSGVTLEFNMSSATTSARQVMFKAKRRNGIAPFPEHILIATLPVGAAGLRSIGFFAPNGHAFVLNDILDVEPMLIQGYSGFPTRKRLNVSSQIATSAWHTYNIMFHSVARLLNDAGDSSLAQITAATDYIESILMTRPISAEIRTEMRLAAQVARVAVAPYIDGDAAWINNWRHVVMGLAQKRARAMVFVLLISPEFSSLR